MSENEEVKIVLNLGLEAINKLKRIAKDNDMSMGKIVTHLLEEKALEMVDRK